MTPTTIETESRLTVTHGDVYLRAAGAAEHTFWLLNQAHPVHFAVVAEIKGTRPVMDWRAALQSAQRKHPLLSACIKDDAADGLCFYAQTDASISLRVIDAIGASWQAEVSKELANSFDSAHPPLLRAALLESDGGTALIVIAHHSIMDGRGACFFIEDVLRALDGETLSPLPLSLPLESILVNEIARVDEARPDKPVDESLAPAPQSYRTVDSTLPDVIALALTRDLTRALIERCRGEMTTVYGAVAAAIHKAAQTLMPQGSERPRRLLTPIDIRHLAPDASRAAGVHITLTATPDASPADAPFWPLARSMKQRVAPSETREAVLSSLSEAQLMMGSRPSVEDAATYLTNHLACDLLLSNLGPAPIPSDYGSVELSALWGPMVLSGIAGEQVIGVCTTNGILRMVHTSHSSIPRFLETAKAILAASVHMDR